MSIPKFFAANIPNPAFKKFVPDLKKYFIIKKWFFRPRNVKISRFFVETHEFGSKKVFFDRFNPRKMDFFDFLMFIKKYFF